MPYQIDWEIPQSVLRLQLLDHVTFHEFVEIDRIIIRHLDESNDNAAIALMVDVRETKSVPQAFNQLKTSQTYATTANLRIKWIIVIGNNRLMRLMMLLTFNLARPSLQFFDTPDQASLFLSNVRRATAT